MKNIYVDHQIITAFLLQNHPHHSQAVNYIIRFLKLKDNYSFSIYSILEIVNELIKELSTAQKKQLISEYFGTEKEIITTVQSIIDKLNLKILFTNNDKILQQALSLLENYGVQFDAAFHSALMLEHKIRYLATFDKAYNTLFREGLLKKY